MFLTHVGDPNTFTQFHCEILRNWFPSELFHRPRGFLSSRSSASFRELERLRTWKAQVFTMFYLPNLGKGAQLMPTHLLPPLQHVEAATLSLAPGNRKMLPPQKNTPPPQCPGKHRSQWCELDVFFQLPDIWTQYECMLPSHQAEMLETILRLIEWSGFFIASTKWLYKLRDSSMAIDKNHHDICDFYTLED